MSSPKKRCIETVEGIAKFLGGEVVISELLNEQGGAGRESDAKFHARLEEFATWWNEKAPTVNSSVGSHGDWLPQALMMLTERAGRVEEGRVGGDRGESRGAVAGLAVSGFRGRGVSAASGDAPRKSDEGYRRY